jgi:hypothetical protein
MKLRYVEDISGDELLEDEDSQHQVMMEWERSYMEKCIELLDPSGSVLEIGFGMGYSANKICSNKNVKEYTIIECSPIVWDKIKEFENKYRELRPELKILLIKGRWQDILCTAEVYDSIYFDDYIGMNFEENTHRFNKFLYEILMEHSHIGTKIGLYSTSNKTNELDCIKSNITTFDINIPEYCKYARGTKMYIPIIEKISECSKDIKDKLFNIQYSYELENKVETQKLLYTNSIVIDNFLQDPNETNLSAFQNNFEINEEFSCKRTQSNANDSIKEFIEIFVKPSSGKITEFNMEKNNTNFNGSYEYTNSNDRINIRYDSNNNWCGILFLSKHYNFDSGISFYMPLFTYNNNNEGKEKLLDNFRHDITKWKKVDYIGNKYNRLIIFRSDQYYSFNNNYGINNKDGRLVQIFSFKTEY